MNAGKIGTGTNASGCVGLSVVKRQGAPTLLNRRALLHSQMKLHVIVPIALCTLGGVVINTMTAFVCAVSAQRWPGPSKALDVEGMIAEFEIDILGAPLRVGGKRVRFGCAQRRLSMSGFIVPDDSAIWRLSRGLPIDSDDYSPPYTVPDVEIYLRLSDLKAGWPLWSLSRKTAIIEDSRASLVQIRADMMQDAQAIMLPTTPIWSGFVVNSAFYAVALFIAFLIPRSVRTLRKYTRTRRGVCPNCAYPVGISDRCSECGTPIPTAGRRYAETTC